MDDNAVRATHAELSTNDSVMALYIRLAGGTATQEERATYKRLTAAREATEALVPPVSDTSDSGYVPVRLSSQSHRRLVRSIVQATAQAKPKV